MQNITQNITQKKVIYLNIGLGAYLISFQIGFKLSCKYFKWLLVINGKMCMIVFRFIIIIKNK